MPTTSFKTQFCEHEAVSISGTQGSDNSNNGLRLSAFVGSSAIGVASTIHEPLHWATTTKDQSTRLRSTSSTIA
jgi:hypothetical protein